MSDGAASMRGHAPMIMIYSAVMHSNSSSNAGIVAASAMMTTIAIGLWLAIGGGRALWGIIAYVS